MADKTKPRKLKLSLLPLLRRHTDPRNIFRENKNDAMRVQTGEQPISLRSLSTLLGHSTSTSEQKKLKNGSSFCSPQYR
jgi:hypothetical protein